MNAFLKKIAPYVAAGWLFAQSIISGQNITGRVIEKETNNNPIPNARIEIYSNNIKTPDITTTNNNGEFNTTLTDIQNETQTVKVGAYSAYNQLHLTDIINGNGKITIYNIIGQKIEEQKIKGNGIQEIHIPLKNIASGIYLYAIEDEKGIHQPQKFINTEGYITPGKTPINTYLTTPNDIKRIKKIAGTWQIDSIKVSGANIEDTITKNYPPQTGTNYNVGTIYTEGKNTITGHLYDLDTKFTTKKGITGAKIYLKSTPEKSALSDNNGNYTLKTANSGTDTLIIEDTTYYNWKHPINIQQGKNNTTAFNDNTGTPMIQRYTDPDNKEDEIEFTQKITDIKSKWLDNPTYINTTPRFKNKTILVYLNRKNAPNSWYPDSAYAGFKHIENDQLKFEETTDSTAAQIHMLYTNPNVGNGTNLIGGSDEQGPYIKNWDINIRGPPGSTSLLQPIIVPYVVAHEAEHAIFSSGEHSQYMKDIIYLDVLSRYSHFTDFGSEKEINARKILYFLERNPKLLEYYK